MAFKGNYAILSSYFNVVRSVCLLWLSVVFCERVLTYASTRRRLSPRLLLLSQFFSSCALQAFLRILSILVTFRGISNRILYLMDPCKLFSFHCPRLRNTSSSSSFFLLLNYFSLHFQVKTSRRGQELNSHLIHQQILEPTL